ncbi:MAG: Molybdate-binding protein ModA [Gammaproteobacteria bacterium]|nr:Molybdate-binding protein ModA [Gammaproteobacteria bacterium]
MKRWCGLNLWLWLLAVFPATASADVLVAAASSIREPFEQVVARFARDTGIDVRVSYGASGNLTHQILRGAPYEIFLSADEVFPEKLADSARVSKGPFVYARGRLTVYAPNASPVEVEQGLAGIAEALTHDRLRHLAVADPELAPYGRAARQALESGGLWRSLESRVVVANSVARAAQFAASGSVDAALVSLSLAISPALAGAGRYRLLPETAHAPLRHAMVLLDAPGAGASRLYAYLSRYTARAPFRENGFTTPAGSIEARPSTPSR